MNGNRVEQTPALHIGWWRNGYHQYERDDQPTEPTPDEQGDALAANAGPTRGSRRLKMARDSKNGIEAHP
jgi:hypothetical protein